MTKLALILVLALVVYGGIQHFSSSTTVYVQDSATSTPLEIMPEWAKDEDAVKAAQEVVKRKALEAELSALEDSFASSTAQYEAHKANFLAKKKELQKEIGIFWSDPANIRRLIMDTFPEDPYTAVAVAMAESGLRMIQSRHTYPKDMDGQKAGSTEKSFCYFQIHAPAHAGTAKRMGLEDYKTNPESCVKVARIVYEQAGGWTPWTVYTKKMHLAYAR